VQAIELLDLMSGIELFRDLPIARVRDALQVRY
jgi:hypothetical protein